MGLKIMKYRYLVLSTIVSSIIFINSYANSSSNLLSTQYNFQNIKSINDNNKATFSTAQQELERAKQQLQDAQNNLTKKQQAYNVAKQNLNKSQIDLNNASKALNSAWDSRPQSQ